MFYRFDIVSQWWDVWFDVWVAIAGGSFVSSHADFIACRELAANPFVLLQLDVSSFDCNWCC